MASQAKRKITFLLFYQVIIMDRYESAYDKFDEFDNKREKVDLDDFEEFMRKVEEVNKMVHALASGDKEQVEEVTKSADAWLANQKRGKSSEKDKTEKIIHEPSQSVRSSKIPVINRRESRDVKPKPPETLDNLNSETMSQEAFMRSVEEDAKKRSEDRKKRIIESDAIKANANKAFRENDFEKALDLYNKAIDVRKDSCVLYTNRALTLLNLGLYTRALKDCETALRLDENNFKATLYKWHALYEMGEDEQANDCIQQLKVTFPNRIQDIDDYEKKFRNNEESDET